MKTPYSYCCVSVAPLHKEPNHTSEQTSQILFGEKAEIRSLDEHNWAHVRLAWDGYEGWCKVGQLVTGLTYADYQSPTTMMVSTVWGRMFDDHSDMWAPLGSELIKPPKTHEKTQHFTKYRGRKINIFSTVLNSENVIAAASQYLNAPYMWGGRTAAGLDCSGLVQMAFKLCNMHLPRDAGQQAEVGRLVSFAEAGPGDVAFFSNAEGRIVHTGIILSHYSIIHATDTSGCVVIDHLDHEGITSVKLSKRTHQLAVIKRIVPEG